MKKTISYLLFLVLLNFNGYAQTDNKITLNGSSMGGMSFNQNGTNYNFNDASALMKSNADALDLFNSAKSNYGLANVFGFVGGFLVGWPLGSAISGKDPNWTLAGIGAGIICLAIPISSSAKKKAQSAVDTYNASLNTVSFNQYKPRLEFASMNTGLGLRLTF